MSGRPEEIRWHDRPTVDLRGMTPCGSGMANLAPQQKMSERSLDYLRFAGVNADYYLSILGDIPSCKSRHRSWIRNNASDE